MSLRVLESVLAPFSGGKFENKNQNEKQVRRDIWAREGTRNMGGFFWLLPYVASDMVNDN